ncbi:right-handed parallel beta-helix repeat-containing protein [Tropicimonas sp. S265A]|uniref:right-handed parallel beta-helix repeat-containing protein n=1 Tax=Tropicimonas sp. S265A TaxID=3415134 RepID=UPI003C7BA15E
MTGAFSYLRKVLAVGLTAAFCTDAGQADPMRPFSIWLAQPYDVAVPLTASIYMPEISRALRATPPPPRSRFNVQITHRKLSGSVPHQLLNRVRDLPAYGGEARGIAAIHLTGGSTDLRTLATQPSVRPYLRCAETRCTLTAPLLVAEGAALSIDGVRLDLVQDTGALLGNHGTLYIRNSHIEAVLPRLTELRPEERDFRPFIAGLEGSTTQLIGSTFVNLGFSGSSAYGVSISARKGERAPTGMLIGNVFEGLYYGFYSHHAHNIAIVDNLYRDNIVYGIDPHDYSHHLWILGNRAYGTRKKHGIIISRGVTDSVIAMNRSHDNARAGIMLDRHSSNNLVIYNHTWRNAYDGIAIYESSGNLIAHNTGAENGKTGLRIRNSADLIVAHNYFTGNQTGIKAYTGRPNGFQRKDEDIYTMEVTARMVGNTVTGNHREDMSIKGCISRIVFAEDFGNQPGFTTRTVTFGGEQQWRAMLDRVAEITRGHLDVNYTCPATLVRPAVERAAREARQAERLRVLAAEQATLRQ